MRASRLLRRVACRRMSSAAEEPKEPTSRWMLGAGALAAVALPSAALLHHTVHRYAEDSAFRKWMRTDLSVGAHYIEEVIQEYFPQLATMIRISDDWQHGDADRSTTSVAPSGFDDLNLGNAPAPQPTLGNHGTRLYRTLNETPGPQEPPVSEEGDKRENAPLPASKDVLAANAIGAAVSSGIGAALGTTAAGSAPRPLASTVTVAGEVAADDPEGEDPASGEVDSSRWSVGGIAEPGAWASGAPPEMPTRLEVPMPLATRFELQMLQYQLAEARLLGRDSESLKAELEVLASKRKTASTGTKMIELPEQFWDPAYGSTDVEHNAATLSGVEAASAWREMRLQWLRVQEAFVAAEVEGISTRIPIMQRRAQAGYGGGAAVGNMLARKRQLEWKLLSLKHEKRTVKRAPWLEHFEVSNPAMP